MLYKLLILVCSILMILLGYLQMSKPELYFRREKWKFRDHSAEPSDEYIDMLRIVGLVKIIVGIIILIMSLNLLTNAKYNNNNNSDTSSHFYVYYLDMDGDNSKETLNNTNFQ